MLSRAIAFLTFVLVSTIALADDAKDCKGANPDLVIRGCTRIIQSPKATPREKAAAYDQRAWAHNAKSIHDRAMDDAKAALRLDPTLATAYGNRGWVYTEKGEFDAAIADYNEALRLNPKLWTVYNLRAWAFGSKGDPDRAIADYGEALRLNPRFYVALNGRGGLYSEIGEYDKAIDDFIAALKLRPGLRLSQSYKAWAYMAKGDYDRALADYDELIRANPSASAYADRGWVHHLRRSYTAAIADFDKAIELSPVHSVAFSNRADTHNQKAMYDRAIADAEAAIRYDSNNKFAYDARGRAYVGKGNYEAALADFNRALELDSGFFFALLGRGRVFLAKNDRVSAIGNFQAAASLRVFRQYEKLAQIDVRKRLTELEGDATPPVRPIATSPPPSLPLPIGGAASAQRKHAFVVGIDRYDNLPAHAQLRSAVGDARAMGETLSALGFSVVSTIEPKRGDFIARWYQFLEKVEAGDTLAFVFSGHGVELEGANYLLPRDVPRVRSGREGQLRSESLSFGQLLTDMSERKPAFSLVVIDACRDNPFSEGGRSVGGRARTGPWRPPIPIEGDHPFQSMTTTGSDRWRPGCG